MTTPAFLLGALIASLLGALFHLARGGGLGRLVLYLVLAWVGFWAGHFLANSTGWTFLSIGPVHTGLAILGAILFLIAGNWLSMIPSFNHQE